jgi:hypothetical protein
MIAREMTSEEQTNEPHNTADEPLGATVERIVFVAQPAPGQDVLLALPRPVGRIAVVLDDATNPSADGNSAESGAAKSDAHALLLMTLPTAIGAAQGETVSETLAHVRRWVDASEQAALSAGELPPRAAPASAGSTSVLMTLQGAQILWNRGRVAILAPEERLDALRKAVVEVSYYEAELRDIERVLAETWPQLEADLPLAFEFDASAIERRAALRERFEQVVLLRARLARVGQHVHCPHLHPPTLASQAAERLRERTQLLHRHEFLEGQIEVFEDVYERCGQRASDFMLARSGYTLEWIIIILLAAQILLTAFEMLTRTGS